MVNMVNILLTKISMFFLFVFLVIVSLFPRLYFALSQLTNPTLRPTTWLYLVLPFCRDVVPLFFQEEKWSSRHLARTLGRKLYYLIKTTKRKRANTSRSCRVNGRNWD